MEPEEGKAFLALMRRAVREELAASGPCLCRLESDERKDLGRLVHMSRDVGVENMRNDHQFVAELREGAHHMKFTALTVGVGSVLTALGAGIMLFFKAKVGN